MKSVKDIKQEIRKLKVESGDEVHTRVLNGLTEVLDKSTKQTAVTQPNIWRVIVKSKITKFAAAAVIIVAVLIGINQFGGSVDVASVAFADVRAAFLAQTWVHVQYDNEEESWYNLKTGDQCNKGWSAGDVVFSYFNRTDNLYQIYIPEDGQRINEGRPSIYKDNIIPPYEPQTAWETIIGHWESIAKNGDSPFHHVEIKNDTLEGRSTVRFDIYYIDAMDRRLLMQQLWADPATKLPIKIKKNLQVQEQKDQNREYITGVFFFTETGPLSIYDLGVPKDLPISRDYDKVADPAIEKIIEAAKRHYENFPKQCRAVIWQNDRESEIEVIWRDGEKIHFNHYFNLRGDKYLQYHLALPTTVDDVLAWAKTQPPISIYINDEKKSYCRSGHPAFENLKTPKTGVTRSQRSKGLPEKAYFIEEHWGYMDRDTKEFTFIDDAPESPGKYVGIKTDSGNIRGDHYIDPEHDYICVQYIRWRLRNGQWEKEREYITTEMAQLPGGQWYATKRKLITYPDTENGLSRHECNYTIDIKLLEADEFPPDTFNGEKLLEGAELETLY